MSNEQRPGPLAQLLDDPLEDLYTEALLYRQTKKRVRGADPALADALDATARRMKEVFSLPENWQRTRGIALVHEESHTLLGNYSEYVHRSVKHCRRLVREHSPIAVDGTELVKGYWWLGERRPFVDASMKWNVEREALVDVHLPELGVAHPVTELRVGLYLGGIMRVELAADTQFASPGGEMLLQLPKGTNLLECMSTDSKIALRKELGL